MDENETRSDTLKEPEENGLLAEDEERTDAPVLEDEDYNLETAAEIAAPGIGDEAHLTRQDEDIEEDSGGRGLGITAIILSIASLFFLPVILGAAGIVIGFMAARRGATATGYWAIGIGALSIVVKLFFGALM
ncbi:hypothetical protein [Bacillus piscicola]|uniref:hypothetical protein n=1 Tax=Bacillus piscicola TaxID=1632684 RepID=UPI001F09114A|nr:hypothetical protein [Bacillus piscicola]